MTFIQRYQKETNTAMRSETINRFGSFNELGYSTSYLDVTDIKTD